MATDTAATPAPTPTLGQLWQMPTFLLGAAVFVAVWQGWVPLSTPDAAAPFLRDITALKTAYEKLTPDANELDDLLKKVARSQEAYPELAPQAHFALGSGYVRLAEITAAPDVSRTYWHLARQHFDQVRPDQLPDPADHPRFVFRSTKARTANGLPANTPAADLHSAAAVLIGKPLGEVAGEANRLAAEIFLRMTPPNFARARDSLAAYIAEAGLATPPPSIARAKLRLSEVHLLLHEPEAARKWLDQLGPDTPPDVFAPSKAQRAQILMDEKKYADAAKDWEQVRAVASLPPGLKPKSAYYLALCKLALQDPEAAGKLFEESAKAEEPVATASAIRLAEMGLRSSDVAKHRAAAERLNAAVGKAKPGTFANPLIPAGDVQGAFEMAVQVLLADAAFEDAEKTAIAYKAVALNDRDREKRAEVLAAWGASLQKSNGAFQPKLSAAAEEYVALADSQPNSTAKADLQRRAANYYRQAGNAVAAAEVLSKTVKLPSLPDEAAGPAWLDYAGAMIAAGRPEKDVVDALNRVMASASPVAVSTRYRLARECIDSRNPNLVKLGTDMLDQVANASNIGPSDQVAHERALVERAHDFIQAKDYGEAGARLRKQLSIYPTGPEAGLGKLFLGVALLGQSTKSDPSDMVKKREEALETFKSVVAEVDAKEKLPGTKLSERDEWLRLQASIRMLETYHKMGKPHDLLEFAAKLRERTRGTVEDLIVLSMMFHANKQLNKSENAARVRTEMKTVFDSLPPTAFKATSGDYSRAFWEQKWFPPEPPK